MAPTFHYTLRQTAKLQSGLLKENKEQHESFIISLPLVQTWKSFKGETRGFFGHKMSDWSTSLSKSN